MFGPAEYRSRLDDRMTPSRRDLMLGAGAAAFAPAALAQTANDLALDGRLVQGGFAIGRTWPRAVVLVDGEALTTASASGLFVVGFDRDAPPDVRDRGP